MSLPPAPMGGLVDKEPKIKDQRPKTKNLQSIMFVVLAIVLLFSHVLNAQEKQEQPRTLELKKSINAEIKSGQVHRYRLSLSANQFVQIEVNPTKVVIVVSVFGTDGKKITEKFFQETGQIFFITDTAGNYEIRVETVEQDTPLGSYEILLSDIHAATEKDRLRIKAADTTAEADALFEEGTKESYTKAVEKYQEAQKLWHDLGDLQSEGYVVGSIAVIYDRLGDAQKALEFYEKALQLARAAGDDLGAAITLDNIGMVYNFAGDYEKAIVYHTQGLELCRKIKDEITAAYILGNIANAYDKLGESQKALDFYQQSLTGAKADKNYRRAGLLLNQIAVIYSKLGQFQNAIDACNESAKFSRAANAKDILSAALNNLASLYNDLSDHEKAIEISLEALKIQQETGNKRGEASTLNYLGVFYRGLGNNEKALEYYLKSLELRRALNDRTRQAQVLTNIGAVYYYKDDMKKALEYFQQGLEMSRAVNNREDEAFALTGVAVAQKESGEKQKALETFNQALALHKTNGTRPSEANSLLWIAQTQRDLGQLTEALTSIESSINIIESLRSNIAGEERRTMFFSSHQDYYDFYIDLLMQLHNQKPSQGFDAMALQAKERANARSLFELLQESQTDIRQGVDAKLLERERALQQQINTKDQRLRQLRLAKKDAKQIETAQKELDKLLSDFKDVQSQIRAKSPQYAALTQAKTASLKEIQQTLDDNTILLEYSLGKKKSFLWLVTKTNVTTYDLPSQNEIETFVGKIYELLKSGAPQKGESINQHRARLEKVNAEYWANAANLSKILFGAAASQLGEKRLLIVADGALHYIPFAALPIPNSTSQIQDSRFKVQNRNAIGKSKIENFFNPQSAIRNPQSAMPLISKHEIVNLPSASVLVLLRQNETARKPAPKNLAVFADPVFESDDIRIAKAKSQSNQTAANKQTKPREVDLVIRDAGVELGRLSLSKEEADAILSFVAPNNSFTAFGFDASKKTLLTQDLSQYRIVHFATHGLVNSRHPELSSIALSLFDEKGNAVDGLLRLHEIYNLKLPAELIVLSACQTGLGKEIRGEGLIGLTRGFMYAGAQRVAVSLWNVQDDATQEMMKRFYQNMLQKNMRPAAALRTAQLEMFQSKRWSSPYHWAAFVLQGEWK
jgi:CHAT domain-containing protein/tetratricopeptide (TPR) repeat protein